MLAPVILFSLITDHYGQLCTLYSHLSLFYISLGVCGGAQFVYCGDNRFRLSSIVNCILPCLHQRCGSSSWEHHREIPNSTSVVREAARALSDCQA
ncbi:hypothetical protein DEU56DRAFT_791937 [Suillus clintonianus]|uniref:uncharacterized protein n=1 Tax=Suillus clintonianus TaxID=1904413 RepID=UPI001B86EECD|nr:uncharacterized protein DEU56DRAFT_791937 [Suillus clintonianus]KAG2143684.1 hypothetical protein DEU56DRAFT_791937 [Suillus clintonianus]